MRIFHAIVQRDLDTYCTQKKRSLLEVVAGRAETDVSLYLCRVRNRAEITRHCPHSPREEDLRRKNLQNFPRVVREVLNT